MVSALEINYPNFECLYQDYYESLCNYAFRYVKNKKVAEDIVSETFYLLWKNKNSLSAVTNIKSYLFKSIYNNCLYYKRGSNPECSISDFGFEVLDYVPRVEKNALDKIIIDELEEAIEKAINNLPDQQAKVFRLKRFEEKKNKEVAEELNISVKTVEAHMSKATKTLKRELLLTFPSIIVSLFL